MKDTLSNILIECIENRDINKGLSVAEKLNNDYPDFAYGWYLSSCMLSFVSEREAYLAVKKALAIDPEDIRFLFSNARYCLSIGHTIELNDCISALMGKPGLTIEMYADIGFFLCRLGRYSEAEEIYRFCVKGDSGNYQHYFNLATTYQFLGLIEEAEDSLDFAIKLNPRDYDAHFLRSNLRKQTLARNHIDDLSKAMKYDNENYRALVSLSFALAKEYEDIGEMNLSFNVLNDGCQIKRSNITYNINEDLGIIKTITDCYIDDLVGIDVSGSIDSSPIFILGMPRTGTTLVERILESHSSVKSAGELNNFAIEMMKLVKSSGLSPSSRLELIDKTTQLDFKKLGENYINSVAPLRDGSAHFIDKLPFNYLYVGLIHLAMPNAKIINLQRHPMDTCYSVYKQLFKDAYPFSYDLKELGQYYVAYRELMAHWNTVMPGVIHTVNYEDVVADTEGEARKLLDYCGLGWEDQCLRFYENKSASTTASATQVRQKVYSSSVGKWRQYEEQLQPLAEILTKAGIDIS